MGKGSESGATMETKDVNTSNTAKNAALINNDDKDLTSATNIAEEEEVDENYVTPPDGGWGWMVVLSSFLIHVIADGVVYSFGVFLTEFVHYFDAGRGAVSWVGSLQPAVTFSVGPLASALTNYYGCRLVTIAGAVVTCVAFVLSVFAPNLYYLYLTAGVMAGLGFGLIYVPAIVCVANYFEKKRSTAMGLAVCGSGFGTFILAPVTEMLVVEYQWQGAMLILGGIILNIVVCGIIFRPLEVQDKAATSSKKQSKKRGGGGGDDPLQSDTEEQRLLASHTGDPASDQTVTPMLSLTSATTQSVSVKGSNIPDIKVVVDGGDVDEQQEQKQDDDKTVPNGGKSFLFEGNVIPTQTVSLTTNNGKGGNEISFVSPGDIQRMAASQVMHPKEDVSIANMVKSDGALHKVSVSGEAGTRRQISDGANAETNVRQRKQSHLLAPLTRKDIFYSGSLQNIPQFKSNPEIYKSIVVSTTAIHKLEKFEERQQLQKTEQGGLMQEFSHTLKDMMSPQLLKNPVFLLFAVSNFFTSIGFNMPFIFLPDRAILAGIDRERATLLVSVIGIANTAGRIIFGFLSDRKGVNRLMLYNTALVICGVATALSAAITDQYILLACYAAVFGMFIGVYVSLTSVVLVDLLGLDLLTNAFGLLLLFQGASTFVGPPIAGWLCDWTGSYDISFIVMGILIAISGGMLYVLPCVQRRTARNIPSKEFHVGVPENTV